MCFLYMNTANVGGNEITKIGISKNPEKRISSFNTGIYYRSMGGHCPNVKFIRRYTIKLPNRKIAKHIEKKYKNLSRDYLLAGFGLEVFNLPLQDSVRFLNKILIAEYKGAENE